MRGILFRGKRLDNGEWVEGNLITYRGQCYIHPENEYFMFDTGNFMFDTGKGSWNLHYLVDFHVDPSTVGQFTGLLDKNSKRVFEGDVCRFREWNRGEMCWIGNIHYENQQFVISGGPNKECETPFYLQLSRFVAGNIEVIGTFHDNPELLEVTPDE